MLDPLVHLVTNATPITSTWGRLAVVAVLFVGAWLLARASGLIARRVLQWQDRRHPDVPLDATDRIASVKRRETLVSFIRALIAYAAFTTAAVLAIAQVVGGVDRLTALVGASFIVILVGFAIQRVLADVIAGLAMFLENWYSVGDTIGIPALELEGVVEDVSLRHTKLRAIDGEAIRVHNSQIPAVRVLPRGTKDLAVELFVTDREEGEQLVTSVSGILPEGATTFVRRPWIERVDDLSDTLHRIRVRASVPPGREWLVESFFSQLVKESAGDDLLVHGPVVLTVDERAARTFARAIPATRWPARVS